MTLAKKDGNSFQKQGKGETWNCQSYTHTYLHDFICIMTNRLIHLVAINIGLANGSWTLAEIIGWGFRPHFVQSKHIISTQSLLLPIPRLRLRLLSSLLRLFMVIKTCCFFTHLMIKWSHDTSINNALILHKAVTIIERFTR